MPVASIMRSKYGTYPEYHTSLDNLELITESGLQGSFDIYIRVLELIERNVKYRINCFGEPQLGKRGLYPTLSTKDSGESVRNMMNFIAYADGHNDLIKISELIETPVKILYTIIENLYNNGLLSIEEKSDK